MHELLLRFTKLTIPCRCRIYASPNGWTDRKICLLWITDIWKPAVEAQTARERVERPEIADKPHVIVWDGHDSHETVQVIDATRDMGHHLFCLPSKTTHRLQPLDVSCFGVLQHRWRKAVLDLNARGLSIHYDNIVSIYLKVSKGALTRSNIQNGFRRTGIYPFNPSIFTDRDFGPSQANTTKRHLPQSYPRADDLISAAAGPRLRGHTIKAGDRSLRLLSEPEIQVASRFELQDALRAAQEFLQRSHAHNIMADDRIVALQAQLADTAQRRNRRRGAVQTEARGLTSQQYLELMDQEREHQHEARLENDRRKEAREERQAEKRKRDAERQDRLERLEHARSHPPAYKLSPKELCQAKGVRLKEIIDEINTLMECNILRKSGPVADLRQSIADYLGINITAVESAKESEDTDKENMAGESGEEIPPPKRRRTRVSAHLRACENRT